MNGYVQVLYVGGKRGHGDSWVAARRRRMCFRWAFLSEKKRGWEGGGMDGSRKQTSSRTTADQAWRWFPSTWATVGRGQLQLSLSGGEDPLWARCTDLYVTVMKYGVHTHTHTRALALTALAMPCSVHEPKQNLTDPSNLAQVQHERYSSQLN